MSLIDYLFRRPRPGNANVAKDRLAIIVAREGRTISKAAYLPQLRQEILQVLARYEKIDLDQVSVTVESQGDVEVLELNVILSDPANVRRAGGGSRHAPFFADPLAPERAASIAPERAAAAAR
jgi:cell division topological specificity factor